MEIQQIAPNSITASELAYGENLFYPVFEGKAYRILCSINRQPGKYFFKVSSMPKTQQELGIKTFLSTSNKKEIIDLLNSWREKLKKHQDLIIKDEASGDAIRGIYGDEAIDAMSGLTQSFLALNNSIDANDYALKTLNTFDKYEELKSIGGVSLKDKEKMIEAATTFVSQYEEIRKKIKKGKEQFGVLRLLNEVIDTQKEGDLIEEQFIVSGVFDVYYDVVSDIYKQKSKDLEDFHQVTSKLHGIAVKKTVLGGLQVSDMRNITSMYEETEEKLLREREKSGNTLVGIERLYRQKRKEMGFSYSEDPVRHNTRYEDNELEEILETLGDLCEGNGGEQKLNGASSKDTIVGLAIDKQRKVGAMIDIFNLAFGERPFRGTDVNSDESYTLRILQARHKLGLDCYGKSNDWFAEQYEDKIAFSGDRMTKSLERNIEILRAM